MTGRGETWDEGCEVVGREGSEGGLVSLVIDPRFGLVWAAMGSPRQYSPTHKLGSRLSHRSRDDRREVVCA